jgi:predicted phosphodiesterase
MRRTLVRTLVLGDVHLTRQTPVAVVNDLARFFTANRGERILLTGDVLDLSADAPHVDATKAHEKLLAHPVLTAAMAEHLDHDGEIFWAAGNHDSAVGAPGFAKRLGSALGLSASAQSRLHASPWFFRLGDVHLEHGHRFDPDNAPAHPLVPDGASLGVHFVEEFIVSTGAHAYLNSNDGTPLELFLSSFVWYGVRAPHVIARFFMTAASALRKSGDAFDAVGQIDAGSKKQADFASEHDVELAVVEALRGLGAEPTLASTRNTFSRLYLDRVAATLAIAGGGTAFALGARVAGSIAVLGGGALMAASWARGHDRYGGAVTERLAHGAEEISALTGKPLVVFGHTHEQKVSGGGAYANPGSFAFVRGAPGRPYLEIENRNGASIAVERTFA